MARTTSTSTPSSSTTITPATTTTTTTTTSQWLLPSSLKLRNLHSISLRNLRLVPTSTNTSTTYDDDALPQTLHSPAKLLALNEEHTISHARSHSDLRAGNAAAAAMRREGEGQGQQQTTRPGPRPPIRKLRRRSTLEWANATPQTRQRKLEATTRERIGDVFLSLHVRGVEEAVYVSEVVERTMNPSFGTIDWSDCGAGILRGEEVWVKVWAKGKEEKEGKRWGLLLQVAVQLRGLMYVGRKLSDMTRSLPANALVFHLPDGVYTTTNTSSFPIPPLRSTPQPKQSPPLRHQQSTSTFDALLRLQKLTDTIQDALETRNQIARDLEDLLLANKQALADRDTLSEAQDRLKTIEFAKLTVSKQLDKARAQQAEKRASLSKRRNLMSTSLTDRKVVLKEMQDIQPTFPSLRDQHHAKEMEIQSQRRRICSDLQICYPISAIPNKPFAFTIRHLHLPHSEDLDSLPPEEISAALGHVAHVLQLLSFYLRRPLPYPVTPRGSTSTIFDPISLLTTMGSTKNKAGDVRTYPLFLKSVPRFRFEYAVFLLGWDLRVLLEEGWGVRVEDPREVLGNLKLCLVVATDGEGELVGRKVGGVRGLLRNGRERQGSDAGSVGSGRSGGGGSVRMLGNGRIRGARDRWRGALV